MLDTIKKKKINQEKKNIDKPLYDLKSLSIF